jgi:hypothetical protein
MLFWRGLAMKQPPSQFGYEQKEVYETLVDYAAKKKLNLRNENVGFPRPV